MQDAGDGRWYLYHLRDPHRSAGFGHDGYVGITRAPDRRKLQHLSALAAGRHRNPKLQAEHNSARQGLQFWIVSSGSREEVLARERLAVPRANHHLNVQQGGGPLRGMTQEEASIAATRTPNHHSQTKDSHKPISMATSSGTGQAASSGSAASAVGVEAMGARTAFTGAGLTAAAIGTGLLTVGLGSAYAMGKTVLKDSEELSASERSSRGDGRIASYVGGAAGAAGTLTAIGASGAVAGLSGAGIAAGVGAIGASVGGGLIAGTIVVTALPAVAACGIGYAVYRASKWLRK